MINFIKYYDNQQGLTQLSLDISKVIKNDEFNFYNIILPKSIRNVLKKRPTWNPEDFNDFPELSVGIIDFYNFMLNFFDRNDLLKMIYNCNELSENSIARETVATVDILFENDKIYQFMGFVNDWMKIDFKKMFFKFRDPLISGTPLATFIHEFGHIIHHFLALTIEERVKLNSDVTVRDINDVHDKKIVSVFTKDSKLTNEEKNFKENKTRKVLQNYYNFIFNKIEEKLELKIDSENKRYLVLLSLTRSTYLHENLNLETERINIKREEEVFAEIFANWYLTPENQRSFFWEINNEYFHQKMYDLENYHPEVIDKNQLITFEKLDVSACNTTIIENNLLSSDEKLVPTTLKL